MNDPILKYGLTTSACASAASKAAAMRLFFNQSPKSVVIPTPIGLRIEVSIEKVTEIRKGVTAASARKVSGDNPDMLNGELIVSMVSIRNGKGINIKGGKGVGTALRDGLPVKAGESAINPVARKMIEDAVTEVIPKDAGIDITIYVPRGVDLAKKTLNPRVGIENGVSIVGTTGLEEPVSNDMYAGHLSAMVSGAACISKCIVLCPGNTAEKYAENFFNVPKEAIIVIGDRVGTALDTAVERGITDIVIFGLPGKLVKIAAGVFNTHSMVADARFEVIASASAMYGANRDMIMQIMSSNTTEHAIDLLKRAGMAEVVMDYIAGRICERIRSRSKNPVRSSCFIIDQNGSILSYCLDQSIWRYLNEYGKNAVEICNARNSR